MGMGPCEEARGVFEERELDEMGDNVTMGAVFYVLFFMRLSF